MASCDWQKIKGAGEAKAMFRHCESEQREQAQHTNKDIDKSRTYLNMQFGLMDEGYEAICKAYDERIADLDSRENANRRKDRVTLIGLSIPSPKGLTQEQSADWFCEVWRILDEQYGSDLLGGAVHFDEVHEYTDPTTHEKRMSRPALHAYIVPEVDGKLNAKKVSSRGCMVALNNTVEAMTKARFGVQFMDGSKKKSRKSVEELKQESDKAAILVEAQQEAAKIVEEARQRADKLDFDAVEKMEKAEAFAVEERRKASEFAENVRRKVSRKSREIEDAAKTSANEVLSDAKQKAEEITKEAQNTLKNANTALQRANQKDKALSDATLLYQNAFDDAKAISKGFAEDAFYQRFYGAFRSELTGLKYKDGSTAWERFRPYAEKAFEEAKRVTKYYNTSPADAYKERVEERVQKAEQQVRVARQVPELNYKSTEYEDDGYSL